MDKMTINTKVLKEIIDRSVKAYLNESYGGGEDYTPRVYVGTYYKYNNGSLKGKWVDLSEFNDRDEFIEYCHQLHADEGENAELMYQDMENIPSIFGGESYIKEELWDYINDDRQDWDVKYAIAEYVSSIDEYDRYMDDCMVFSGCNNMSDVAYEYIDEIGGVEQVSNPTYYFDYESFGRDCSYDSYGDDYEQTAYEYWGVDEDDNEALGETIVDQLGWDGVGDISNYFDYEKFGRALEMDANACIEYDGGIILVW